MEILTEENIKTGGNPNWFKRHLNWTLVLAWFSFPVLFFVAMFNTSILYLYIVCIILSFLTTLWVIHEKNRSVAWLLFYMSLLIGIIVWLALENRSEGYKREHYTLEDKNYESHEWLYQEGRKILEFGKIESRLYFNKLQEALDKNRSDEKLRVLHEELRELERKEDNELKDRIEKARHRQS